MFSRSLLFLMPVLFPAHNSTWHGQNLPCKQQLPHLPRKQVPTLRKWSCDPKFSYHGCWSGWSDKKKTEPGTRGWLRKGLQIPMDGLTDWPTDGRQVQYLREYVFDAKKGPFKIWGKYFQKSAKSFLKNKFILHNGKKGRIEFSISFLESRGNSELNGIIQIFFYIN